MRKFKVSLLVMVVLGTLFGTGCNDMHNVFHERSGGMVATVNPMTLKPSFTGTDEAQLVTQATFPTTTISFTNLNAIPCTVRTVKIDYYDYSTGQLIGALTSAINVGITVPGTTSSTATSAAGGTQTQTQTREVQASDLVINPWNEAVKTAMYGNLTTRTDNRPLEARAELYADDVNGNTFVLNAAFTLIP